jgi:AraC-like DNA-binding protein
MLSLNRPTSIIKSGTSLQQPAIGHALPFEIHTIDWVTKHRWGHQAAPHRHNYYQIIWVKEGAGTHLVDLEKFGISNDTVYCLAPGQIYLFNANEQTAGYVVSFTSEFLCLNEGNLELPYDPGFLHTHSHAPVIKVNEEMQHEMQEVMEKMIREYDNFFLLRAEILKGFLKIFLIYLTRQFQKPARYHSRSKNMELTNKFLVLLEKNYTTCKMVSDYAEELFVTSNYLNEIVKKVSGFPASYHIRQRIVLEAKRQAIYANASMKEIAYHLGFDDIAHFSKFFKNVSGMSFTEFKKEVMHQFSFQ